MTSPAEWCQFVGAVNWLKHAKKWVEAGFDLRVFYTMPLPRLYCVLFTELEEHQSSDEVTVRNRVRKRKGLPLIPEGK